jgi:hypothetical protein
MRRAIALAATLSLVAGGACAETWTKYVDGANGTAWSYDGDYSYKDNLIQLGAYKPSAPLAINDDWRKVTPKKAEGADNEALMAAVCPHIDHVPVK